MKIRLLLIMILLSVGMISAQSPYKLVTIHDIQYIDSVNSKGFTQSPLSGDTVRVRGVIMVSPVVNPDTARDAILYIGSRWGTYIQDTATGQFWSGLNVLQNDTTSPYQGTFFDVADTGDYVEMTGVVTPYGQTNELMLLIQPTPVQVNYLSHLPKRPDPVKLSVTDFMNNQQEVKEAFKYSGMYVELHNLVSANRNTTNGSFNAYDENGNYVIVYPQSRYYRLDKKLPYSTYQVPADGTTIATIRGIVSVYNDVFEILPLYPGDVVVKATPPTISNIKRNPVQVNTNMADTIFAKVNDFSAKVVNVQLHYKVGDLSRTVTDMQKLPRDTTIYYAVIPSQSKDSTLINYYITALDDSNLVGYAPSDTLKGNYFYQVLDGDLKIRDIQYSPFGSGYSSYNGYKVTLTGVITADTSDIPGFGSGTPLRVYMQNGSGPWTGILIGTAGMKGVDVLKLKRGDNITLTGIIDENYGVTQIDSLSSIVVNSSNNPMPDAVEIKTGDIDKKAGGVVDAEQWESVLVDYKNVSVTDVNADGDPGPISSNHGEIYVDDGSGDARVELQDGNHNYNNDWDSTLAKNPANINVTLGSTFTEIRGIMFYSYSYFKLVPRKNDDFIGFVTSTIKEADTHPITYNLDQNYPNPFNPSTVISYSIPKAGIVTLKIYNILGQEVRTLVNDFKSSGKHTINFNARNLSSGVYFYALHSGNYYQVKKMMLLK